MSDLSTSRLLIGDLAKRSATGVQTIRYYEQQGLMPKPERSKGGQRRYEASHADRLAFIRHAHELGFHLQTVRQLLRVVDQPDQSRANVSRLSLDVLADVEGKLARLEAMRTELRRMARQCRDGRFKECRLIDVLAYHKHSGHLGSEVVPAASPDTPKIQRKSRSRIMRT